MTDIAVTPPTSVAVNLKSKESREAWVAKLSADSLAAVLPRHLTAETFAKVVGAEFVRNPKLAECTPVSLALCLITAAQHGLSPSSPLGHAYLIPRENRKIGKTECTLLIGYKGLCELARRTGEIARMDARCVYDGETFDITGGTNPEIVHKPSLTVDRADSKIIAAYAVAVMKDGGVYFDFVTRHEIDARRARSGTGKYGPWADDFAAMSRKSAIRKLLGGGLVPLSAEIAEAIDREDREDGRYDTSTEAPRRSVASILSPSGPSMDDDLMGRDADDLTREAAESDRQMESK
jgi:recombination protein RecT